MNILIVASGKHGSTIDIARALATGLSAHDHMVFVSEPEDVESLTAFDAVIVGSAIYMSSWQRNMRDFAKWRAEDLRALPVWLFSVGMSGEEPKDIDALHRVVDARGHHLFRGRLDSTGLTFLEKSVAMIVRSKEGDARDWDDVADWADTIQATLTGMAPRPALA